MPKKRSHEGFVLPGESLIKNPKTFLRSRIHLEVEPLGEKAQVFYFIDPKDLKSGLALKKNIVLRGNAIGFEEYLKKNHANEIREHGAAFDDIIALPAGNKAGFLVPRIPNAQTKLNQDQTFTLDLTSGLVYSVILNPGGLHDRAPFYINLGPLNESATMSFLEGLKNARVTGSIDTENLSLFHKENPLLKAQILHGNRLVSSISLVDKEGRFSLEIIPAHNLSKSSPLTLIIEPINSECGLPTVKHALNLDTIYDKPDLGVIDMGKLGNAFSSTINLGVKDNEVLGEADVYIRARIGTGEVLVKKAVDDQAKANFPELYEGIYDIAVVMPLNSPYGTHVEKNIRLSPEVHEPISITLSKRASLDASVVDANNNAVPQAHVEFSRIGKMGAFASEDIFEDLLFKQTLATNDQGQICYLGFSLGKDTECKAPLLDEGRYLAHVIPPAGSELPHFWATFDFPKQNSIKIELPEPELLVGKIVAPDQISPIKQAYITIYRAEANLYNQPKIVANAITDSEGVFKALVAGQPTKAVQTGAY